MTPDEKKLLSLGEEDFFGLWEIAGVISPAGHEAPLTAAKRQFTNFGPQVLFNWCAASRIRRTCL